MKKALILSGQSECSVILETNKGLIYTQCYAHYLEKFKIRVAKTCDIMAEFTAFYGYFK